RCRAGLIRAQFALRERRGSVGARAFDVAPPP
ncbi:ribonuclease, partial [Sinorhizobium meliloti]